MKTTHVLTFMVDQIQMALPVDFVQEILLEQAYTTVPLSGEEVCGMFSLRGQVITAVDMRKRLHLNDTEADASANIIIKIGDELSSLVVDEIGEVIQMEEYTTEPLPGNMRGKWGKWCDEVIRTDGSICLLLNLDALLEVHQLSSAS